jgi:hypothetical protein
MSGGDLTRVKELERIKLYEFYNALAFFRTLNEKE